MNNNTEKVYIHVETNDPDISDEQIKLDNYHEDEYTNPYDEDYSDVMNVGGIIEGGDIFADR